MLVAATLVLSAGLLAPIRTAPASLLIPASCSGLRASLVLMGDDTSGTSGRGFGAPPENALAEERGRKALEALKAATADQGHDSTLQGLQGGNEPPVEVMLADSHCEHCP